MSYLLDTDTSSAYLQGNTQVFGKFVQHSGRLYLSILSVAEPYSWVFLSDKPEKREDGLLLMLSDLHVIGLDHDIVRHCGMTRASLRREGKEVPTVDMLIAATAIVNDLTVVTHNQRHFRLIPDLRLEDWLAT
jgi:predicted nucleic acid-binding protein